MSDTTSHRPRPADRTHDAADIGFGAGRSYSAPLPEDHEGHTMIQWRGHEIHYHDAWLAGFHDGRRRDLVVMRQDGAWWPHSGPFGEFDSLVRQDAFTCGSSLDELIRSAEECYGDVAMFAIGVTDCGRRQKHDLLVELWFTAAGEVVA